MAHYGYFNCNISAFFRSFHTSHLEKAKRLQLKYLLCAIEKCLKINNKNEFK